MEKKLDLRIEKTYLALHTAFTELLEERRFEDFTVRELCDRAMIRRTTFYKHFADKYEYYTFYLREICAAFQDQLAPDVLNNEVNPYFIHMSRELLRFMQRNERLVSNIAGSSMFPVLLDILSQHIMHDLIQAFHRVGGSRKMSASQIEGISAFYAGGLLNTLRLGLNRGTAIDEEEFIQIVSRFLINEAGAE